MSNRSLLRPSTTSLLVVCLLSAACSGGPLPPSPQTQSPPTVSIVTVAAITPAGGTTRGATLVAILGSGFQSGATVSFDGIAGVPSASSDIRLRVFSGALYIETPPHAAGPVAVVVTNPDGHLVTVPNGYTYVSLDTISPVTIDFTGDWAGGTGYDWQTPMRFSIRNNALISAACGDVPVPMPSPLPTVGQGEFAVVNDGTVVMTGKVVTDTFATGTINGGPCGKDQWVANKTAP